MNATNGAAPANPSSNVGNGATARSLKAPGLASAAAPPEVELVVEPPLAARRPSRRPAACAARSRVADMGRTPGGQCLVRP